MCASIDPGYLDDEYIEVYSLKKYYEIYKIYFQNLIFNKKEIISEDKEFPNLVKSNVLLKEKNNNMDDE
jgi:hypothetical protein